MLCCRCKQNEAVKTYKLVKYGQKTEEELCLACYNRLALQSQENGAESGVALSACPYCGTTEAEIRSKKIVGCANCYKTLQKVVQPLLVKMQGKEKHKGKFPIVRNMDDGQEETLTFENALEEQIIASRVERQSRELTAIIEKLKLEKNYKDAKGYADKLSRMNGKASVEEDFVWR